MTEALGVPVVELAGDLATTHKALAEAGKRVEEANRTLLDAQAEFRKALAAHMSALTGGKVEP